MHGESFDAGKRRGEGVIDRVRLEGRSFVGLTAEAGAAAAADSTWWSADV